MDSVREPVVLALLVETGTLRWYVAGVRIDGVALPLVCSEAGNLAPYVGVGHDEQVSFLRHRFSGALQRGCDRLWARQLKPCQIVLLADAPFAQAGPELFQSVGEHFVAWMAKPPVVAFLSQTGFRSGTTATLDLVAGAIDPNLQQTFVAGLPQLFSAIEQREAWEIAPGNAAAKESGGS